MTTEILSKKCSNCGEIKNISLFLKRKSSKDGFRGQCKPCMAEWKRLYSIRNKDMLSEKKSKYYSLNKEEINSKNRAYHAENKERMNKISREWREKNKDYMAEYGKKWYKENIEKVKIYLENNKENRSVYLEANKEKISKLSKENRVKNKEKISKRMKAYSKTDKSKLIKINSRAKRRFQKFNSTDGTLPMTIGYPLTKELQDLLKYQNNKCYSCGCELINKHLDHHIPLSKGGTHSISNVVWLCATCNLSKSNKMPTTLLLV